MAVIKQKDKYFGITYVYKANCYWDKEKKQSRSKCQLIGSLNEEKAEVYMKCVLNTKILSDSRTVS